MDHGADVIHIGSNKTADIVLTDPTVSRRHAENSTRTRRCALARPGLDERHLCRPGARQEGLPGADTLFEVGRTEMSFTPADEVIDVEPSQADHFENLLGNSVAMREVFGLLERVAPTDLTVLISGETNRQGARQSRGPHPLKARGDGPFVVFDCGATSENLIESELFGHNRGAFTGAIDSRPGRVRDGTRRNHLPRRNRRASSGTPAQAPARARAAGRVRRVGATKTKPIDVRVVAATNRNLREEVDRGRFREDLYYRLAVVEMGMPSLRERTEDLPMLARHLLERSTHNTSVKAIDQRVLDVFSEYHWPGNVREAQQRHRARAALQRRRDHQHERAPRIDETSESAHDKHCDEACGAAQPRATRRCLSRTLRIGSSALSSASVLLTSSIGTMGTSRRLPVPQTWTEEVDHAPDEEAQHHPRHLRPRSRFGVRPVHPTEGAMSSQVTIANIAQFVDQEVTLNGWLYNIRGSGKIAFPQLRDGTGIIQCVAKKAELGDDAFDSLRRLGQESSLSLTGTIHADDRAQRRLRDEGDRCRNPSERLRLPHQPKEHGPAFLHDHRHLWMRSKKQHAILKIRHLCVRAIRDYFDTRDYLLLDSPIFTPNPCEGTSTLFETEYFGQPAYLSQSGQLYQEAGAMAFGKTYTFGPTFRAEGHPRRHLTEFWMVEPEVAYANIDDIMDLAEDFMVEVVKYVLDNGGRQHLEVLERDISVLENVQKPFSAHELRRRVRTAGEAG